MRTLLALLVLGSVTGAAVADLRPPDGFKRVKVVHRITTDKEYTLYNFYTVVPVLKEAAAVKLDPKTPIEINNPGLIGATELVAVPKVAAKNYSSDKEFLEAVAAGKVEGTLRSKTTFMCRGTVKEPFKGDTLVVEHKLEKIDAKDGLVVTRKPGPGGKDDPEGEGDSPSDTPVAAARAPLGGVWFAGLAAALGVALGGFWLAARTRRKV